MAGTFRRRPVRAGEVWISNCSPDFSTLSPALTGWRSTSIAARARAATARSRSKVKLMGSSCPRRIRISWLRSQVRRSVSRPTSQASWAQRSAWPSSTLRPMVAREVLKASSS